MRHPCGSAFECDNAPIRTGTCGTLSETLLYGSSKRTMSDGIAITPRRIRPLRRPIGSRDFDVTTRVKAQMFGSTNKGSLKASTIPTAWFELVGVVRCRSIAKVDVQKTQGPNLSRNARFNGSYLALSRSAPGRVVGYSDNCLHRLRSPSISLSAAL